MGAVKIREVGNDFTVTLPRDILTSANLMPGDKVIPRMVAQGSIMLDKVQEEKSRYVRHLENFYKKPIEEIGVFHSEEIDWGPDVGEEVLDEY